MQAFLLKRMRVFKPFLLEILGNSQCHNSEGFSQSATTPQAVSMPLASSFTLKIDHALFITHVRPESGWPSDVFLQNTRDRFLYA